MKVYYSDSHKHHNPPYEDINKGELIPSFEVGERVEQTLQLLRNEPWAEILSPQQFSLDPILAIHSSAYLEYLQTAYENWETFSPVPGMAFIPYSYGIDHQTAQAMSGRDQKGLFLLDSTVGISSGTYAAAIDSAFCALSGAKAILQNDAVAVGLCRPPGHHAGREICGGYCFLNNAAIAANWLSQYGTAAVLDIDYHAGNGTQAIFYHRRDVFTISIHADPAREYPYYAGFAHETGTGEGLGFHQNFPLPAGIGDSQYLDILENALDSIRAFNPYYLVVSAGMDIYQAEPMGDFRITQEGIQQIGTRISKLGYPSLIILEGGYYLPKFGENFQSFLQGFIK